MAKIIIHHFGLTRPHILRRRRVEYSTAVYLIEDDIATLAVSRLREYLASQEEHPNECMAY